MAKSTMKTVGVWAFIIGVVVALLVGVLAAFGNVGDMLGTISIVMAVLGLIVGILNITESEVNSFIIAAIGLATGSLTIAQLGSILPAGIGSGVMQAFSVFGVFVAGAVFMPALKSVYKLSKD
jgi:hypothetical protein